MTTHDISAVLTVHAEGTLVGASHRSLNDAIDFAKSYDLSVEKIIVMDKVDRKTEQMFNDCDSENIKIIHTDFGDQGKVRNYAASRANGKYIAFLDGDDLWGNNWLYRAYQELENSEGRAVVHPEVNWFFQGTSSLFFNISSIEDDFDSEFLRHANYWDALCMCSTALFDEIRYSDREIEKGFAYEDWYWNCETIDSGVTHIVAENTVHFKRRRDDSQTIEASKKKVLCPMSALFSF